MYLRATGIQGVAMNDEYYMKRAIILARRGLGRTSPNPVVGAVIEKGGRIIGEGYHRRYGGPHAEINAINNASEPVAGATLYLNLEPCCHHGKTPPCVEALIAARLARVVIGMVDPNPLVAGRGIELLRRKGIEVTTGVLEAECRALNEVFIKYIKTSLPYITLKLAQTLDGRIATKRGHSRWISSEEARRFAHRLRSHHDAVLVGSGTIHHDDPALTVRLVQGRNPLRVVVDSNLSLSPGAEVLKDQHKAKTVIFTTDRAEREKIKILEALDIEIVVLPQDKEGRVELSGVLANLGRRGVSSLLVEGGAKIATSLLAARLVDRLILIMAPKILGRGIEAVGDLGINTVGESLSFYIAKTFRKGGDLIIEARPGTRLH